MTGCKSSVLKGDENTVENAKVAQFNDKGLLVSED